jgi:plastocyanin
MRRLGIALGLFALAAIGIIAGALTPIGSASPVKAQAPTLITVSAKEFSFTMSKRSVPVGTTVTFNVVNKGKITHNFFIAGKVTKMLSPGQSAKLTVKFSKKGLFPYLCTLTGHANAGMKGKFAVGVAAPKPTPVPTTTTAPTTTTTPPPTSTVPVGTAKTTVTVNMVDYAFQLSQSTIPSGQITFVIHNIGNEVHNFAILGNKAGAQIAPGTSETWTVSLPPGTYNYQCDVPFHVDKGMVGQFTVTP